ncbi:MAG: hypothetical protein DRJ42_02920 [Deltaproteobacteria bacterium]|nr:MAG: hypothetical protein DRJ42_02920 [Deltaproteobacteria bacterium]
MLLRVGALVASLLLTAGAQAQVQDGQDGQDGQDAGPASTDSTEGTPDAAETARGTIEARRLFFEGVAFVEALDWSRAAERFRAVRRIRPTPPVEYNLAAALFELGQLNESEEIAVHVLEDSATDENVRASVESLLERIRITGGQLTVRLEGPRGDESVFLDAREIASTRVGTEMTTSVGDHVVEARRGQEAVARANVLVTADEPVAIDLDVHGELATRGPVDSPGTDDDSSPGLLGDWRFWAAVGGAVVVVAVIVIIAAVAAGSGGHEAPIAGNFQPGVLTWD